VDLWIVRSFFLARTWRSTSFTACSCIGRRFLRALYQGHMGHHRAFQYDAMAVEAWSADGAGDDAWFSIALLFVGMAPIVWVTARTVGPGPAGLLLVTSTFSFVFYEMLHALYHFPVAGPGAARARAQSNLRFSLPPPPTFTIAFERMRWVNFNISVPLSDIMFGTRENRGGLAGRAGAAHERSSLTGNVRRGGPPRRRN